MIDAKEAREESLKTEERQSEKEVQFLLNDIESKIRNAIKYGELSISYFFYTNTNNEEFINTIIQRLRDEDYQVKTYKYNINLIRISW